MQTAGAYLRERLRRALCQREARHPTLADRRLDEQQPVVGRLEGHVKPCGIPHAQTVGRRAERNEDLRQRNLHDLLAVFAGRIRNLQRQEGNEGCQQIHFSEALKWLTA